MASRRQWVASYEGLSADASLAGRVIANLAGIEVLVLRVGEEVFALDNACSHLEASLRNGAVLLNEMEIECPWHKGRFDLRSGAPTLAPCTRHQPMFEVNVEGDDVYVVPPATRQSRREAAPMKEVHRAE